MHMMIKNLVETSIIKPHFSADSGDYVINQTGESSLSKVVLSKAVSSKADLNKSSLKQKQSHPKQSCLKLS